MIGTLLQQSMSMLKGGKQIVDSLPPRKIDQHEQQISNHQPLEENKYETILSQFKDNQQQVSKLQSHKRDSYQEKQQLVDIFYQLVSLVNRHSKLNVNNSQSLSQLSNSGLLSQIIVPNRLPIKKKNIRAPKMLFQSNKVSKQSNNQNYIQRQSSIISNPRQNELTLYNQNAMPVSTSLINLQTINMAKKSSFPLAYQSALKNYPSNVHSQSYTGGNSSLNSEALERKNKILKNYKEVMAYQIHSYEDQIQPVHTFNVFSRDRIKSKNIQPSLSQYSFAHSSKNADEKQKDLMKDKSKQKERYREKRQQKQKQKIFNKFRAQKTAQITVQKNKNFRIEQQFNITKQRNNQVQITYYGCLKQQNQNLQQMVCQKQRDQPRSIPMEDENQDQVEKQREQGEYSSSEQFYGTGN